MTVDLAIDPIWKSPRVIFEQLSGGGSEHPFAVSENPYDRAIVGAIHQIPPPVRAGALVKEADLEQQR